MRVRRTRPRRRRHGAAPITHVRRWDELRVGLRPQVQSVSPLRQTTSTGLTQMPECTARSYLRSIPFFTNAAVRTNKNRCTRVSPRFSTMPLHSVLLNVLCGCAQYRNSYLPPVSTKMCVCSGFPASGAHEPRCHRLPIIVVFVSIIGIVAKRRGYRHRVMSTWRSRRWNFPCAGTVEALLPPVRCENQCLA